MTEAEKAYIDDMAKGFVQGYMACEKMLSAKETIGAFYGAAQAHYPALQTDEDAPHEAKDIFMARWTEMRSGSLI